MATIIGIAGSLRKGSFNAALLREAVVEAPAGLRIEIASIREIPLYDADVEAAEGLPEPVVALKSRIAASDGLLIVTPEYNGSIPGVVKNAIDWLSRPASDIGRVFRGKAVALMGATPGAGGTRLSQTAWLPVLRILGLRPWFDRAMFLASAGSAFDAAGKLTDEKTRERLRSYLAGFAEFVGS